MNVRYAFRVYGSSFNELSDAAKGMAEKMFGYPPSAEAFVEFEVRDYVSSVQGSAFLFMADVTVEIGFS